MCDCRERPAAMLSACVANVGGFLRVTRGKGTGCRLLPTTNRHRFRLGARTRRSDCKSIHHFSAITGENETLRMSNLFWMQAGIPLVYLIRM